MSLKLSKTRFLSPLTSLFTKRETNRVPLETLKKVKIDSYLISMSLLSQHFSSTTSVGQAFWKRSHQWIILLLQWFMLLKWLFCVSFPDYQLPAPITGDFTFYLPGDAFNYHFVLTLWSMIGVSTSQMFFIARKHHKLNLLWLTPFELCKGTVKHQELKMGVEEASDFWQRVIATLWLAKTLVRIIFLIASVVLIYILKNLWPQQELYPLGVIWAVVTIIWIYYTVSIQLGVIAVFHMICYYFIVQFRKLNEIVRDVESNQRMDLKTMHLKISIFMIHHNCFTNELTAYNKFWQYYIVMNFVIYMTTICFFVELIIFTKMFLWLNILALVAVVAYLICLVFTSFSAGAVSDQIHEPYGVLNAVTQKNMPIILKTQLQIYIQRIGGPTIGFSCWDLFVVTYDGFLQALLMVASFFLLFMDVTQSEKKKKNPPMPSLEPIDSF